MSLRRGRTLCWAAVLLHIGRSVVLASDTASATDTASIMEKADTCSSACQRLGAGDGEIKGYGPICTTGCSDCDRHCVDGDDIKEYTDFGIPCLPKTNKVCCCEEEAGGDRSKGEPGLLSIFAGTNCSGELAMQYALDSVHFAGDRCVPFIGAIPTTEDDKKSVPNLETEEFSDHCLRAVGEDVLMVNCSTLDTETYVSLKWYFIGDKLKVVSQPNMCLDSNTGLVLMDVKMKTCDATSDQQKWEFKGLDGGGYNIKNLGKCLEANAGEKASLVNCDSKKESQIWRFSWAQYKVAAGGMRLICDEEGAYTIALYSSNGCTDAAPFASASTPAENVANFLSDKCADAGSTSVLPAFGISSAYWDGWPVCPNDPGTTMVWIGASVKPATGFSLILAPALALSWIFAA